MLLRLTTFAACAAAASASAAACPAAATACTKDASCHAFGVHGDEFQLHGCATKGALVANSDWTIYVPTDAKKSAFKPLGQKVNVDEDECPAPHPKVQRWRCSSSPSPSPKPPPKSHPVPAPTARPYENIGSIDVLTLENTIFWWANKTYVLVSTHAPPPPQRDYQWQGRL